MKTERAIKDETIQVLHLENNKMIKYRGRIQTAKNGVSKRISDNSRVRGGSQLNSHYSHSK